MARILITGSADGLGRLAAKSLLDAGHEVIVHARSTARLEAARDLLDRGARGLSADLADLAQTRQLAEEVNGLGRLHAVIHNAGVYEGRAILPVNVVAPYVLTAMIDRPPRLIYLSSGMHLGGHPKTAALDWSGGKASGSYSDSKLFVTALAAAAARIWPNVISSAVNPGWVPTKMGGPGAPDDLRLGHLTQEWLATSDDPAALISGQYWFHQSPATAHPASRDRAFQDQLLCALRDAIGVEWRP